MYNMYLMQELEKETLVLKISELPEEIEIKYSNDNKKYNVLALGDVITIGEKGLKDFSIKSLFLADEAEVCIKIIETMIKNKKPMRFVLNRINASGYDEDINLSVLIDDFAYKEVSGEGDIYYTLKFTEYREFKAKEV